MTRLRVLANVPGPFYVEDGCCTQCGVPEWSAPELFGDTDADGCFVKRQPTSPDEVDRMLRTMYYADLGCIRYDGHDIAIARRLAESNASSLCDNPLATHVAPIVLDHVGLRADAACCTLEELVRDLTAFLDREKRYTHRAEHTSPMSCDVHLSWFRDECHAIVSLRAANTPGYAWLVVGSAPFTHEWLSASEVGRAAVYFTKDDWLRARTDGRRVPW